MVVLYILIFLAFGLSLWAQFKVKGNFKKWSEVEASSGLTGAEVARKMLDSNGLSTIPIEITPGVLSDHYDPMAKTVRLSEDVYHGTSIASISVASHEIGHAIQDKESYKSLVLRHKMFPAVNFSSGVAPLLLMGGFLLQASSLIGVGILLFSLAVAFQLVTLPVEFNASNRAKAYLVSEGVIAQEETRGVKKVLGAAALTYVAAALISVLELAKFVLIFLQGNNDD